MQNHFFEVVETEIEFVKGRHGEIHKAIFYDERELMN